MPVLPESGRLKLRSRTIKESSKHPELKTSTNKLMPNKYKFIVNDLKNTGYCDDVIEDEIISYISTNLVNEWKVNKKTVDKFKKTSRW